MLQQAQCCQDWFTADNFLTQVIMGNASWIYEYDLEIKGVPTLPTTCRLTLLIDMSRDQSRRRVNMSRIVFFCRSTCQADRHSVSFQQRMSIDRLQCAHMSVDIDGVELDKH